MGDIDNTKSDKVLTCIDMHSAALEKVPQSLLVPYLNLTSLILSSNKLSVIPEELVHFTPKLTYLDVSFNRLAFLPPNLGNWTHLYHLLAEYNQITTVPTTMGKMRELSFFNLGWNPLCPFLEHITRGDWSYDGCTRFAYDIVTLFRTDEEFERRKSSQISPEAYVEDVAVENNSEEEEASIFFDTPKESEVESDGELNPPASEGLLTLYHEPRFCPSSASSHAEHSSSQIEGFITLTYDKTQYVDTNNDEVDDLIVNKVLSENLTASSRFLFALKKMTYWLFSASLLLLKITSAASFLLGVFFLCSCALFDAEYLKGLDFVTKLGEYVPDYVLLKFFENYGLIGGLLSFAGLPIYRGKTYSTFGLLLFSIFSFFNCILAPLAG